MMLHAAATISGENGARGRSMAEVQRSFLDQPRPSLTPFVDAGQESEPPPRHSSKMSGPTITAVPTPQHNHLLAALSATVRERVFPHLELVSLPSGKVLKEPGDSFRHVYFLVDAIVSVVQALESGATAETALVGNEGLIGVSSFMGGRGMPSRAVVLSAGYAYRLVGQRVREEFNRHGEMQQLLLRYALSRMTEVGQTAGCNRRHTISQQLCRWLLLAVDRSPIDRLAVSQETIAHMLGVRRESVSVAAAKLQKLGVIEHHHGQVVVRDRAKLEQLSCECYAAVKKETDRLLPRLGPARANARGATDSIAEFPPLPPIRLHRIDDAVATLPISAIPQEIPQPA